MICSSDENIATQREAVKKAQAELAVAEAAIKKSANDAPADLRMLLLNKEGVAKQKLAAAEMNLQQTLALQTSMKQNNLDASAMRCVRK